MSNAFDAQTAWQTRNSISGAFNLLNTNATVGGDSSNSGTSSRAGYRSPTPENNSSNAENSRMPSTQGTQTLPHDFAQLGRGKPIATGVYYCLIPKNAGASTHIDMKPYWFPVTGDSPVDFSFSHQWDQADNLAKRLMGTIAEKVDPGLGLGQLAVNQGQHLLGGLYLSGCSVYNSSAPPTISVATKLFSVGGNNLIEIIETLRGDTHARLGTGGSAALGAAGAGVEAAIVGGINAVGSATGGNTVTSSGLKAGTLAHPGWWTIEVVSFADNGAAAIVASMSHMICTGLKVTMYSPWLGIEPSYMELRIDFQHAYPGLRDSMRFGGRNKD